MKPLANSYIQTLQAYQPGLPIDQVARTHGLNPADIIKLASNENPLGMSPAATAALQQASPEAHRYPEQYPLLQALAHHLGVQPGQLVLGNGSNDVLDLVARTFLRPGTAAVSSQYAFAVYAIATQSAGAQNIIVTAANYGHDLPAMLQAVTSHTQVVWIANPNNPTGTFIAPADVQQFLTQLPARVMVVLDEAYHEYLGPENQSQAVQWVSQHPNLIVTRTFSKIYGLAGLRVGYGIASPEVAELLNRVRQPFNVNSLAAAAAIAALSDHAFVQRSYQTNATGRTQLRKGLQRLQLSCLPAYGNFITVAIPHTGQVADALLRQGVIVRPLAGYGMPDHVRITIGTAAQNRRVLAALSDIIQL